MPLKTSWIVLPAISLLAPPPLSEMLARCSSLLLRNAFHRNQWYGSAGSIDAGYAMLTSLCRMRLWCAPPPTKMP